MDLNVKAFTVERIERRAEANEMMRRANAIDRHAHQAAHALMRELAR